MALEVGGSSPLGHPNGGRVASSAYCASSSMAEQRTLNPQVLGSNPRGRTFPQVRELGLRLKCVETAFRGLRRGLRTRKRADQVGRFRERGSPQSISSPPPFSPRTFFGGPPRKRRPPPPFYGLPNPSLPSAPGGWGGPPFSPAPAFHNGAPGGGVGGGGKNPFGGACCAEGPERPSGRNFGPVPFNEGPLLVAVKVTEKFAKNVHRRD